jgi:hypothetical protein
MPAVSKKQAALFFAVARSSKVAKKTGMSQAAAKKLVEEQKGVPTGKLPVRVKKKK